MSRQWKPGDMWVTNGGLRLLRVEDFDAQHSYWIDAEGDRRADAHALRPLVVIDPEDRAAIERLADVFCAAPSSGWVDNMQAAFRRLVEPPKPEEPTGLGAVVECEGGALCVRTSDVEFPWIDAEHPTENAYHWTEYGGLPSRPVRVLSDGWAGEDR